MSSISLLRLYFVICFKPIHNHFSESFSDLSTSSHFLCLLVVFSHSNCGYPDAWDNEQILCVSGHLGDYIVRVWILFDLLC